MSVRHAQITIQKAYHKRDSGGTEVGVVKEGDRLALPVSALSLAFAAIALPVTYIAVPFCRPAADALSWTVIVGIVSASGAIGLTSVLLSLFSLYAIADIRARTSLAMSVGSLGIATAFMLGVMVALRACS